MRDRKFVYLVTSLALGMLLCTLAAVIISTRVSEHAIEVSERGQCESLAADLDAYREEPPTTKSGKHLVAAKQARYLHLQKIGVCPT